MLLGERSLAFALQAQHCTTSHVERVFLTVRQELKRFQRKGLGYSKDLEMHKHAIALLLGVYNFVRKHHTIGTTPAVAAGLEEKPGSLERVVEMTSDYMRRQEDAYLKLPFLHYNSLRNSRLQYKIGESAKG